MTYIFTPVCVLLLLVGVFFLSILVGVEFTSRIKTEKVGRKTSCILCVVFFLGSFIVYYFESKTTEKEKYPLTNLNTNDVDNDNLLRNGGFEEPNLRFWGTGYYEYAAKGSLGIFWTSQIIIEENGKFKLKAADASGKIDSKIRKFGKNSFKITMKSPTEPDVYATMSQRIDGLMKNTKYVARFWIKAERAGKGTFEITTDNEWNDRKQIDGGEYDWREFKHKFNIGDQTSIDFRIISEEPGTVWVDGISFKRHFPDDKESG